MNRTKNPHKGGVPKGRSWTVEAANCVWIWMHMGRTGTPHYLRRALTIIRDHSRRAATRAEATRLLTLLEAKHG